MNLSKKERKKLAYARLEVTDRACDGCEQRIGRWTHKCVYDVEADRCYGNACGCVDAWKQAPRCASCDRTLMDPSGYQKVSNPSGSYRYVCDPCMDKAEAGDGTLWGFPIVNPENHPQVPEKLYEDILTGPHVVIERPYIYNVVLPTPGGFHVVSALRDLGRAFERCAEENR